MKNILFYIILAAAVGLGSCKKNFLEKTPPTSLSSASFYKDLNQFQQALNASYTPLRTVVNASIYQDEMRSDNTFFSIYFANRGLSSQEGYAEFMDDALATAVPNSPGDRWTADYQGISMINTILGQITTVTGISQGAKDSVSGEALFLRAYYYYDLVTHYGGVPLQLTEITSASESFQPRNTVDEVYKQIITDLTTAIPQLPVVTAFPQSGRASKGAAKVLLAYAYMTEPTKDYASAEAQLLDVTNMHYALLPNYADVFDPANKNNQESIFEVQYMSDLVSGQQSNFAWQFMPKATNSEAIMGYHTGAMNIFSGWNVPTQEMVSSYETGDKRLDASVAVVEGTISGVEDFTITGLKSSVGYTPIPGQTFFYMIKKYFHPPYTIDWNTPDDWPVFRYSGALLLLAECLVNENKAGAALPYLNQVRARAGLAPLATATVDNVANEMRHELAFENHRWTDLIRIGQAIPVLTAKGVRLKAIYGWLLPTTFNVTQNRLIYPIASREIQINTKLVQNPGY
ncbi:MAG TPA: RagB/SusD family nutrient uptake outer membrane protein [Puia sp.]